MYTDVANANVNPLGHFLSDGWREKRNPSRDFDTNFYLTSNPDVLASGVNPLVHYVLHGKEQNLPTLALNVVKDIAEAISLFDNSPSLVSFDVKNPIDIIIPIYNGYDYLAPLFHSVKKNTSLPFRLIIVNDCSPDVRIMQFIEEFLQNNSDLDTVFINNEQNLGFVKSVNKAVSVLNNHFVLLNTDTEVPSGWLERLMYPIFKMDNIASTTPFTNAGTICSFPNYLEDNSIFE